MSTRPTTAYGARPKSDTARALDLTRAAVAFQPGGAAFGSTHDVRTWQCTCGLANPVQKLRCKFCLEPREGQS